MNLLNNLQVGLSYQLGAGSRAFGQDWGGYSYRKVLFIISSEKVSGMGEGTHIERCPLQYLVKKLFGKAR